MLLGKVTLDRPWYQGDIEVPAAMVAPGELGQVVISEEDTKTLRDRMGQLYTPEKAKRVYLALKAGRSSKYIKSLMSE